MRTVPTLLSVALTAACVLACPPADADGETCEGQPATIVHQLPEDGPLVDGTDGDDVIVVTGVGHGNGAIEVRAKSGDDLICVSGEFPPGDGGGEISSISGDAGHDGLTVLGSETSDHLAVDLVEDLDVRLGADFDAIKIDSAFGTGLLDGGPGGGRLQVEGGDRHPIRVYLNKNELQVDDLGSYVLRRWDRVIASAKDVTLVGDKRGNHLWARGCRIEVYGGAGDDVLKATAVEAASASCGAEIYGQDGDDRLIGTDEQDVLIGGPGRDKANGGPEYDRCVTEVRRQCER